MNAKNLNLLLGVAVVVLLGAVGYLVFHNKSQTQTLGQQNNNANNAAPINSAPAEAAANTNTQANSDIATPTVNWKTYTNAKSGFEFKYPTNFIADGCDGLCVGFFADKSDNSIRLSVLPKKFDPNNIDGLYGPIKNPEQVQIGNRVGYRYLEGDGGCGASTVVTALGSGTLKVEFGACEDDKNTANFKPLYNEKELMAQILGTFKFTK
jgi:hypothetical protein